MAATDNTTELITSLCEYHVASGPFAGMCYETEAVHSAHLLKLLGCYERELHACLERSLLRPYQRIVNIGCGEGYYAVGLALRLPQVQVYAFDTEPRAQELCRAHAAANGVEKRMHVHEGCTIEALRKVLKPGTLIVCDCEGCEIELLRPDLLPVLNHCDLLLELHDNNGLNASGQVMPRFQFSHAVQVIPAMERTPAEFDAIIKLVIEARGNVSEETVRAIQGLSDEQKREALNEARHAGMRWLCLSSVPVPAIGAVGKRAREPVASRFNKPLITGCILARNEAGNIEGAVQCLRRWTDEVLVIDNESEDDTAAMAERCGARVVSAPHGRSNFDGLRNLAIEAANGEWIFYLDADERVPAQLGTLMRRMVEESGDSFEALRAPFKTYFCGQWMQHCGWWPGYTRPQLLKKDAFDYGERLHSGIQIDGRERVLPFETAVYAIDHYSYDDIAHYLEKINRYTLGEAENLREDGLSHGWRSQMAHFLLDWQGYYDRSQGRADGMQGFILSFFSGVYRFLARAKLWDLRRRNGQAREDEEVPASVLEALEFWASCLREGAGPWLRARHDLNAAPVKEIPQD